MRKRFPNLNLWRSLPLVVGLSMLLPCTGITQDPPRPTDDARPLAVAPDRVRAPGRVDPDYGKYAPDFVPLPIYQRVKLTEPFRWSSKARDNPDLVTFSGAKWIQLHFLTTTRLGQRSSVTITSAEDGDSQTLTSLILTRENNSSAMFNGDTVRVEVNAAAGESILIEIEEVSIGVPPPPESQAAAVSNNQFCNLDNRSSSFDPAVGRTWPHRCTGWIISNGAHLTAGHCHHPDLQKLQFQVPQSEIDGSPNNQPLVKDQYTIETATIRSDNSDPAGEAGQDWTVFKVQPNSETGLLPAQEQKAFYRLTDRAQIGTIGLTGFGFDITPPGPVPPPDHYNSSSWTQQQVPNGRFDREFIEKPGDVKLKYWAYSTGGSSGSPVADPGRFLAIGIHTNRCISGVSAAGTGFKNQTLKAAIEQFPGPNAVYVDNGHPETLEDGSIFRPYDSVNEGLNAVPADGILSIVTGTYTIPANTVVAKPVTLTAPVGPVTITAQ